jgi:hypothetical protein
MKLLNGTTTVELPGTAGKNYDNIVILVLLPCSLIFKRHE